MDYDAIILALRDRCAEVFGNRVAGAAEFEVLPHSAKLLVPAAYVIPLDDSAEAQASSNGYMQTIKDSFSVVVVLSNSNDERGQTSIHGITAVRKAVWKALLGWQPDVQHDRIEYEGGQLLSLDRARMYYQLEFSADTELGVEDTYQGTFLAALPQFDTMGLEVDTIDPVDPNLAPVGPDGRIEVTADIPVPQD